MVFRAATTASSVVWPSVVSEWEIWFQIRPNALWICKCKLMGLRQTINTNSSHAFRHSLTLPWHSIRATRISLIELQIMQIFGLAPNRTEARRPLKETWIVNEKIDLVVEKWIDVGNIDNRNISIEGPWRRRTLDPVDSPVKTIKPFVLTKDNNGATKRQTNETQLSSSVGGRKPLRNWHMTKSRCPSARMWHTELMHSISSDYSIHINHIILGSRRWNVFIFRWNVNQSSCGDSLIAAGSQ